MVGLSGIEPESYPPQGQILTIVLQPVKNFGGQKGYLMLFTSGFYTLSASQNSFAIAKPSPLEIGIFSFF